jgi:hypothetical protein
MLCRFSQELDRSKSRRARKTMHRKLVWIENQDFLGWGCSECAWRFKPSGSPTGKSLREMKQNYERECSKDFAAHVCAEYPKAKNTES